MGKQVENERIKNMRMITVYKARFFELKISIAINKFRPPHDTGKRLYCQSGYKFSKSWNTTAIFSHKQCTEAIWWCSDEDYAKDTKSIFEDLFSFWWVEGGGYRERGQNVSWPYGVPTCRVAMTARWSEANAPFQLSDKVACWRTRKRLFTKM